MNKTLVKEKKFAAILSITSNSILILLKFIAGVLTGSIGIISEAVHSSSDLLASIIMLFSIFKSSQPADDNHEYGHEKFEDFTSLIEGLLIILAAFYIIVESLKKILFHHYLKMDVNIGLGVMLISVIVNIIISTYIFKIAKRTQSSALYADGEHLRTDVYSSLAVFIGLLGVKLTGNPIYDPIIAITVAIIIFSAGYKICKKAQQSLLDVSLSKNEKSQIKEIIQTYVESGVYGLKHLRTRKAGLKKNIDITLIVDGTMQISTSHKLCDKIEEEIEIRLKHTDITIHLEPNF